MKITSKHDMREGMNRRPRAAFTLVELLLVLSILALLAGLVLPRLIGTRKTAEIKTTITQIGNFKEALSMFEADNGHFPKGKNGLNDLIVKPRDASPEWKKYLDTDKVPDDPWGTPFAYECPGRHNPDGFDLSSAGPDKQFGTEDDINNWSNK
jgi:general secretion pathway protein G